MKIPSQESQHLQQKIQQINDTQYKIEKIQDQVDKKSFYIGSISNNLKYIIAGEDEQLKIWKYQTNFLMKTIKFEQLVQSFMLTEDSQLLYVGNGNILYQFNVNNQFKKLCRLNIHKEDIQNIYCITNTIILTSSWDKSIIKTDVNRKQLLLQIYTGNHYIFGFDYNKSLNIIGNSSNDKAIKLWSGQDGSLIIQKQDAHNNNQYITQLLFIINNNQLISLDLQQNLIVWNVSYQRKQLEQLIIICDCGQNMSLIFQQQYIITIGKKFIKVYTIKGQFVIQFNHQIDNFLLHNTIQHNSMRAVLIIGQKELYVCKIEID